MASSASPRPCSFCIPWPCIRRCNLAQALPEGLLALAQTLALLLLVSLLAVLAILGLFLIVALVRPADRAAAALALLLPAPIALLHPPVLAVPERVVPQVLLVARHVLEVAHRLLHLAAEGVGHPAVGLGGPQVLQDVAKLVEQALGLGHVAAPHGVFHLLEHAVEVVLGNHPVGLARVGILRRGIVLHALGEFPQEPVHGLAQFVGQAPDLLVRTRRGPWPPSAGPARRAIAARCPTDCRPRSAAPWSTANPPLRPGPRRCAPCAGGRRRVAGP